jgi:hypothetical protein
MFGVPKTVVLPPTIPALILKEIRLLPAKNFTGSFHPAEYAALSCINERMGNFQMGYLYVIDNF